MTNILLVGGTGTLGIELLKVLVPNKDNFVTVFSRDPHKQAAVSAEYGHTVRLILGDVRDKERVMDACVGQNIVIHAAALKRIERGETDAAEYLGINIDGTVNVARAADRARVDRAIFVSSDKACSPLNLYGISKAAGEHIWRNAQTTSKHTVFNAVRYGNVMGSNGSVWQMWQRQRAQTGKISVRAPEPTRFVMTKKDAVDIIDHAIHSTMRGVIFVPHDLPAFSLFDLARVFEPDDEKWDLRNMLVGEKQHEVLLAPGEPIVKYNEKYTLLGASGETTYGPVDPVFSSARTPYRLTGEQVLKILKEN